MSIEKFEGDIVFLLNKKMTESLLYVKFHGIV